MARLTATPAVQTETMAEKLARLEAENEKLRQERYNTKLSIKVSEKGGVSVYGLGRFPVTLYGEQWIKLMSMSTEIVAFIRANESKLSRKE